LISYESEEKGEREGKKEMKERGLLSVHLIVYQGSGRKRNDEDSYVGASQTH
jgi:hypothetical protein